MDEFVEFLAREFRGPRIIAADRQGPRIYPPMIPLCSRFDSVLFTPNMSAIASYGNFSRKRRKRGRKTASMPTGLIVPQSTAPTKSSRKRTAAAAAVPLASAQPKSVTGTPLRIPYGNKEVALKLGARYGSAGWYEVGRAQ